MVTGYCKKFLHIFTANHEGGRVHERVAADLIVLPEFLVDEYFDVMLGITDETKERHGTRIDTEVCFQILCGGEGWGFDVVDFAEFLQMRDLSMGE